MSKRNRSTQQQAIEQTEEQATETQTPETPSEANIGKNGRLRANGLVCLCGCGEATKTGTARFLPGHDAKLRAAIRSAKLQWSAVPEIARPFFLDDAAHGEATAGLLVVDPTNPTILRDVKAERRFVPVADGSEAETEMAKQIAELKAQLEATKIQRVA